MSHVAQAIIDRHDHPASWWNEFWSDPQQHFGPARQELIDIAVAEAEDPSAITIVDIASGNGRYAVPFAVAGMRTTAIEKSPVACGVIQERATNNGVAIDIIGGDFLSLPNEKTNHGFNVVFSSGLLEEVAAEHQPAVVEKVQSITRPCGLLMLKFCLEIQDRGVTVEDDSVLPLFKKDEWTVVRHDVDKHVRESIATIDFENRLRTELIIARKST
jgi:2-polyprenyl-3-methyl-5-hydroxy-6-metoxy-1,4-benzoquinol methylase